MTPGCTHRAMTLVSQARGFVLKADCGSRRNCEAARRRWHKEMRERFVKVEYLRAPDLWTVTSRTREQDALILAQELIAERRRRGEPVVATPEQIAPLCMYRARDRGDASDPDSLRVFGKGLSYLTRVIERQWRRQMNIRYSSSRQACLLLAKYGTSRVLRGRPGACWRIRMKEVGEVNGRLHAHAASDFDFIHHGWLNDHALACGLGFVQYSRKESREVRRAAQFSGRRERAQSIAVYLSKYLAKGSEGWPWPSHTRLVSSARGVLPARIPASDVFATSESPRAAVEHYFGVAQETLPEDLTSWFACPGAAPATSASRAPPATAEPVSVAS